MSESNGQQNQPEAKRSEGAGMGLGGFALGTVRAAETQDASEIGRRTTQSFVWIVALVLIVAGVVWWFTQGVNQFWRPGPEDEAFLAQLRGTKAAQSGEAKDFAYDGRLKIRCAIDPRPVPGMAPDDPNQKIAGTVQIRNTMKELVLAFSNRRPNEEVSVVGYQGEDEFVQATFKPTSATQSDPDSQIWIHIKGDDRESSPTGKPGHGN